MKMMSNKVRVNYFIKIIKMMVSNNLNNQLTMRYPKIFPKIFKINPIRNRKNRNKNLRPKPHKKTKFKANNRKNL